MFDALSDLVLDIREDVPDRPVIAEMDAHRELAEEKADGGHVLDALPAVVIPGDLDVGPVVVDEDRECRDGDEELIAADAVGFLDILQLRLLDLELRKDLSHLVASGPVVDQGVFRPFDPVVALLEIAAALLVESCVLVLFPVGQHHVIVVRFNGLACKGLFHAVHQDLEGGPVEERVVDVKEDIARLLGLEDPAAEKPAADDLEGIDEGVLDKFHLEFGQVLHMEVFKGLRRVLLHQRAVLGPVVGRLEGGMGLDDLLHDLAGLPDIVEFLVELHHGVEVVHGGEGRVELVVHHVELLRRQGVRFGECLRVALVRGLSSALGDLFFIEVRDLFRCPAQEDLGGRQVGKVALGDQGNGGQGVPSELVEIVADADPAQAQGLFKGLAELFLQVCLGRRVIALEISRLRLGQGLPVQLAVGLEGDFVDLEEVRRDHVVGESPAQLGAELVFIKGDIRRVVGAQKALAALFKSPGGRPVDPQSRLHSRLDLRGLDPVAVDLDHVVPAPEQDIVARRVLLRQVTCVEESVDKGLLRLLRQVDVAPHIGVLKAELAGLAVRHFVPVLVQQEDPGVHLRMTDRAGAVGLVDPEKAHREAALGAGVDVDQVQARNVGVVGRLAPDKEHPEEGGLPAAQHTDIGGREEGDGDLFGQEKLGQGGRVLDGLIGRDVVFAAEHIQGGQDDDDGRHKVHGGQGRDAVLVREQGLTVLPDRQDRPLQVPVLVQDALGVSGRAGGIDREGRVVGVCLDMTCQGLRAHHVVPVRGVQLELTAAVLPDIADPVRRIGVLDQGPGRTRLPDPDHGDDREHAPGQVDQDKVLPPDPLLLQPCIDPARHLVELVVIDALGIGLIKQDRRQRIPLCVFLQTVEYCSCHGLCMLLSKKMFIPRVIPMSLIVLAPLFLFDVTAVIYYNAQAPQVPVNRVSPFQAPFQAVFLVRAMISEKNGCRRKALKAEHIGADVI